MKVKEMILFTNRNCLIFNENDEQICEYQSKISCSHIDKKIARRITLESEKFSICKFREWTHEITKEEMQYILGVHSSQLVNDDCVCYGCGQNVDHKCIEITHKNRHDHECVVCGSSHECLYYNGDE